MNFLFLIPLLIGVMSIMQGSLNRQISNELGIAHTVVLGTTIFLIFTIALYFVALKSPSSFPEFFQVKQPLSSFKLWYIFPALFGFGVVIGMPFAILKLGAVKVTVYMIAAQMVTSVIWDIWVEKISINKLKVLGIILAFLSVLSITFSKK